LRLLSAIVSWAVEQGTIDRHPFAGLIKMEGDGTRETVITDPGPYQHLIATMNDMVDEGSISAAARGFFITILLTGMRHHLADRHAARRGAKVALEASRFDGNDDHPTDIQGQQARSVGHQI
jgi:hypothetical protein